MENVDRKLAIKVLNLNEGCGPDDVKRAFRTLAQKYHPDKHPGLSGSEKTELEKTFKDIVEAAKVLNDEIAEEAPIAGPDFISTLMKIRSDTTPEERRREQERADNERMNAQAERLRAEQIAQEKKHREAAARRMQAEIRRLDAEKKMKEKEDRELLEKDMENVPDEAKPYLVELHSLRSSDKLRMNPAGYVEEAKNLAALEFDQDRKMLALTLIKKNIGKVTGSEAVEAVGALCVASGDDSLEMMESIIEGISAFECLSMKEKAASYGPLSVIEGLDIKQLSQFSRYLESNNVFITDHKQLDRVVSETASYTNGIERVCKKRIVRNYIDPNKPIDSYLTVLPFLLTKNGDRALSIAHNLFLLPEQKKDTDKILRIACRVLQHGDDIAQIGSLTSILSWSRPFRMNQPESNFDAMERMYYGTRPATVETVVKSVNIMLKIGKNASPIELAETAALFHSKAVSRSADHERVNELFAVFLTKSMVNGGLGWNDELRKVHQALEAENRYYPDKKNPQEQFESHFRENMGAVVNAFFETYDRIPDEIFWLHPFRTAPLETSTLEVAKIRAHAGGRSEDCTNEFIQIIGRFNRKPDVTEIADITSRFFDEAKKSGMQPDEAVAKLRYLLRPKAMGRYWTEEMLDARIAMDTKSEKKGFMGNFDVILRGFFSAHRLLPYDNAHSSAEGAPSG